ncbi:endo-1,4-beta-xylanase [Bacteroides stercoris]|nr:endo-1,4-beta-xylanase [Bacteroides stercoris]
MYITGHCLIGHSQLAQWFCVDKDGKNVSPEILQQRMKNHINEVYS